MKKIAKVQPMSKMKQHEQVIEIMRKNGGYATLGFLNQQVDVSRWGSQTPFASIRRIVQIERYFFKIRPGLWALQENRSAILKKLQLEDSSPVENNENFTHAYYQGLIVEIGNLQNFRTYIPPQDGNKKYLETPLKEMVTECSILPFTYEKIVNRAKTIDVIWFNPREMPAYFFEVEHTTDMQNSLLKFCELQDFFAKFYIIARAERHREFLNKLEYNAFGDIKERVQFFNYDDVSRLHAKTFEMKNIKML